MGCSVAVVAALVCSTDTGARPGISITAGPTLALADTGRMPGQRARPMLMLGVAVVGTEAWLRGGLELATVARGGRSTSGFTGLITHAGVDFRAGFVQGGLGLGGRWGDGSRGVERIAGAARGELGVRLTPTVAVVGRVELLLGSALVEPVAGVGLQWSSTPPLPLPPPRPQSTLDEQPAIRSPGSSALPW